MTLQISIIPSEPYEGQRSNADEVPKSIADSAIPGPTAATGLPPSWVQKVNKAWDSRVGSVIETGDLLINAKKELSHGEWSAPFERGELQFGLRMAEMLMAVARHPALRNPNNFSTLPGRWSLLHVLSRLPVEVVEREIATGAIRAEMKLVEARRLVRMAQAQVPTKEEQAQRAEVKNKIPKRGQADLIFRAIVLLNRIFDRLERSERYELITTIRNLMAEMERSLNKNGQPPLTPRSEKSGNES